MESHLGGGCRKKIPAKPTSVFVENRFLDDMRNENGETPLHLMAKTRPYIVRYEEKNKYGDERIRQVYIPSKYALTEYAVSCGCEVDARDNYGITPLMAAVTVGEDVQIINNLLTGNANIYATNNEGLCALKMVIEKSKIWLTSLKAKENHLVIILLFFEKVTDDFLKDRELTIRRLQRVGFPMALLPFIKNIYIKNYLLQNNFGFEEKLNGLTALHVAVMTQDVISFKMLLAYGHDVNALDSRKQNVLFAHDSSASYGTERFTILKMLLERGTSLDQTRDDGITPMEYLLKGGTSRTLWTVLESNTNLSKKCGQDGESALHFLVQNDNLCYTPRNHIKFLLNKGFNVNTLDKNGTSALTLSIKHELEKKIEFLLKIGAKANWIEIVENTNMLDVFMNGYYRKGQDDYYQWVVQMIFSHQGLNVKNLFDELNTSFTRRLDKLFYGQIVIAHLAIAESTGEHISDSTLEYIKSDITFDVHYEICKERIEQMKNIVINESVTFYDCIIANDYQLHRYVCNQDFLSEFKYVMNDKSYQNSYYFVLIRKRIENSIKIMELRKKAGHIICERTGLNSCGISGDHYVIHKIVSFLSNRDVENMFEDPKVLNQSSLPRQRSKQVEGNIFYRALVAFFARIEYN